MAHLAQFLANAQLLGLESFQLGALLVGQQIGSGVAARRLQFSEVALGLGKLTLQFLLGFYALAVVRPKDPSNIEYLTRSLLVSGHVLIGATLFLLATLILAKSWQNLVPASEARRGAKDAPDAGAATA